MALRLRHLTATLAAIVGAASLTAAGLAAVPDAASSRHYDPIALADVTGAYGLRDLDDRVWTTDALRDRVVLVDAWATWCAPCLAELPRLRALAAAHPDRLVILGLSLDTMPRHAFVGWLRRHDITWPQVFDGRGYGGAVATRIGIDTLPASWLFDADGRLVASGLRGEHLETVVHALAGDRADGANGAAR